MTGTSGPQRDTQRSRTYAAEQEAFAETLYAEQLGMAALIALAAQVAAHPWWRNNGASFDIRASRADATHSTTTQTTGMIAIAPGMEDPATLSHELAHLFMHAQHPVGCASHGPEFRAAMSDVAVVMLGTAGRDRLLTAYRAWKLPLGRRTWPEPCDPLSERGVFGDWLLAYRTREIARSAEPRP